MLTQKFPKAPKMPWLWQIASCFSCIQNVHLTFEEVADLPFLNPHKVMLSKTPFSPRVCPKQENLLFVVSFVNGASSAEVCHAKAHNMYYSPHVL